MVDIPVKGGKNWHKHAFLRNIVQTIALRILKAENKNLKWR